MFLPSAFLITDCIFCGLYFITYSEDFLKILKNLFLSMFCCLSLVVASSSIKEAKEFAPPVFLFPEGRYILFKIVCKLLKKSFSKYFFSSITDSCKSYIPFKSSVTGNPCSFSILSIPIIDSSINDFGKFKPISLNNLSNLSVSSFTFSISEAVPSKNKLSLFTILEASARSSLTEAR